MPIYEFYCPDCNTIFNFFCRRIVTDKKPACPKCGARKPGQTDLARQRDEALQRRGERRPGRR